MPDEGLSARGEFELLLGQADLFARKFEQTKADVQRVEAFAASGFVLTLILLREMLASGTLSQARAVQVLNGGIGYLRRMYRLDELEPQDGDTIDTEKLLASMTTRERQKGAEDLLVEVLAAIQKR